MKQLLTGPQILLLTLRFRYYGWTQLDGLVRANEHWRGVQSHWQAYLRLYHWQGWYGCCVQSRLSTHRGIVSRLFYLEELLLSIFSHPKLTRRYIPLSSSTGYCNYIVGRPALYELLLRQIPPHKVLFNKRVLKIAETESGVNISTTDKSTYDGDILVGADGAYSAVRQRMYETLKAAGTLPKSDQEDLPFKSTCLVGQTKPLDFAADFPEFLDESGPFYCTLSKTSPYTWTVFPTINGNLCWMVMHHLDKASSKAAEEHRFRESENSQWGSHAAQAMCDETRHFILPFGNKKTTLGDLYDLTPKDRISKVMLEEKVFQTWYSERTVLLGDGMFSLLHSIDYFVSSNGVFACWPNNLTTPLHLSPLQEHMVGQCFTNKYEWVVLALISFLTTNVLIHIHKIGAVTAMHDALALANLIYALPNKTPAAIEEAFSEYQAERIGPVTASYNASKALSMVIGRGLVGTIALFLRKYTPLFIWDTVIVNKKKSILDRPTAGFLRKAEIKGTVPPTVSPSSEKARKVFEWRTRAVSVWEGEWVYNKCCADIGSH